MRGPHLELDCRAAPWICAIANLARSTCRRHGSGLDLRSLSALSAASACGRCPLPCRSLQADFGITRADASLPYTLAMMGFAFGGVAMGRLCDPFGVVATIILGLWRLAGYVGASIVPSPLTFALDALVHRRRRFGDLRAADGRHVALVSAPPRHRGRAGGFRQLYRRCAVSAVLQHAMATVGWRQPISASGGSAYWRRCPSSLRCGDSTTPIASMLRGAGPPSIGVSPNALMVLLCVAGLACCVAMAMPQVHIVAYCGDLGYGPARGAEMLSVMLGFGIFSRIGSGLHRRPHRRPGDAAARLRAAGRRAVPLSPVRRPCFAVRDLGAVRTVPGRHRADVRDHRARVFLATGSGHPPLASC